MGTCLLEDDYGVVIGALEKDYKSVEIVERIFHLWTGGLGKKPTSWGVLVTCLRFAELNRLADDIESAYNCAKNFHAMPSIIDEEQFKHVFNMITTICQINTKVSKNRFIKSNVIKNASVRLDSIVSRLNAGKIRAGVVGVTKAGKSTTLNALLGNQYLPASVQSQTAAEVSIVHTNVTSGELYGITGKRHGRRLAIGYQNIHDKLVELNAAARKGSQNGYEKLILHAPLQFLMKNEVQGVQFELSDTPGLGEAAAERFSLARS